MFKQLDYVFRYRNEVFLHSGKPCTVKQLLVLITLLIYMLLNKAPMRMKSVVMAMWLLVAAVGNLIIIIVASVHSGLSNVRYHFDRASMATTIHFKILQHFRLKSISFLPESWGLLSSSLRSWPCRTNTPTIPKLTKKARRR